MAATRRTDKVAGLLVVVGRGCSASRSGDLHGCRRNGRERRGRYFWRGRSERVRLQDMTRREKEARGGSRQAGAWRRRRHAGHAAAWLPVEEDKAGSRWAGPAKVGGPRPWREVSLLFYLLFFFFCYLFWLAKKK